MEVIHRGQNNHFSTGPEQRSVNLLLLTCFRPTATAIVPPLITWTSLCSSASITRTRVTLSLSEYEKHNF